MTTPSTSNSRDSGGTVGPVAERGAVGPSATRSVVKGEVAPRLPHERDESSDSGTGEPSEYMQQAADDLEHGRTDVPRSPQTQAHYSELTEEAQAQAARPDAARE